MALIQAVRDYFVNCPLLEQNRILGIDRLGTDPMEYSIDILPCEPVIKKYVDGSEVRQLEFTFGSREAYGRDVIQNLMNSAFYEQFSDWVWQNDRDEIYPDFGAHRKVRSMEVISSAYALEVTEKTSRYQIQLRITYLQTWNY